MSIRPKFTKNMNKSEFLKYYWYKTELQSICSEYNLPTIGTKAELQEFILDFLDGKNIMKSRTKNNRKRLSKNLIEITLDTKLIDEGFKFDNNAREFFASIFNVKKFSFTKEMAAALREAEKNNDKSMCVQDLVDIYLNSKLKKSKDIIVTKEDLTYQWNNFLKDFYSDKNTKNLNNKLLVASFLWKKVRDTPGEKIYKVDLLHIYGKEILKISENK